MGLAFCFGHRVELGQILLGSEKGRAIIAQLMEQGLLSPQQLLNGEDNIETRAELERIMRTIPGFPEYPGPLLGDED